MYLSQVQLNPQRRKSREALANPQLMHAMVASCLPPGMQTSDDGRLLWRVDRDGHDVKLYIVSPFEPSLEHIVEQAGWTAAPGRSTDYDRFLSRIAVGQRYAFRATLNPIKQQRLAGSRGKRLPYCREEEQIAWLIERAPGWGFSVPQLSSMTDTSTNPATASGPGGGNEAPAVRIIGRDDRAFTKGKGDERRRVTQRHVTFVGQLSVEDPRLLSAALRNGMGRGKAYGCGLMTLARDS